MLDKSALYATWIERTLPSFFFHRIRQWTLNNYCLKNKAFKVTPSWTEELSHQGPLSHFSAKSSCEHVDWILRNTAEIFPLAKLQEFLLASLARSALPQGVSTAFLHSNLSVKSGGLLS